MQIKISINMKYSLSAVIDSHGWIQLLPFTKGENSREFNYVLQLESGDVINLIIYQVRNIILVDTDYELNAKQTDRIKRIVGWMLGLDQNFDEFYEIAKAEPKLKHIYERSLGRLLRCPTMFEDTVKTILTTNTSWSGTIRMVEAFVSHFGNSLPGDIGHKAFPTPEAVALSDEETIRSKVKLGYRSPYILDLARAIVSGELNLEGYKQTDIPSEKLAMELLAIRGVGDYAAANLLMILGRYDQIPIDSWAKKMVSYEWHENLPVNRVDVERAFEQYGRWKGLVFWFWPWSYREEIKK